MSGPVPVAPDFRETLWTLEAVPQEPVERCLVCEAGSTRFAVPIEFLRSVEPFSAATPLPQAPAWVVGVTNVRGTVVGVVDLAKYLSLGETAQGQGRLLICGSGPRLVGFAVTQTRSVLDYPPSALLEAEGVGGRIGRYVNGLLPAEGTAVPLLDMGRLLADEELVKG